MRYVHERLLYRLGRSEQAALFTLKGALVHYAAFKQHISFYPTASGVKAFEKELDGYTVSKGTIHFPLDQPLPLELVKRIVRFRVGENMAKAKK